MGKYDIKKLLSSDVSDFLVNAILQSLSVSLVSYILTDQISDYLSELIHNKRYFEIQIHDAITKAKKEAPPETNSLFLMGHIKMMLDLFAVADGMKRSKTNTAQLIKKYKNLPSLLEILDHKNTVSHAELAEQMKLSAPALSNLIKRLNENEGGLIRIEKHGRYKYYSLTEASRKVVRELRMEHNKNLPITASEKLLIQFIDIFRKQVNRRELDADSLLARLDSDERNDCMEYIVEPKVLKSKVNELIHSIEKSAFYEISKRDFTGYFYAARRFEGEESVKAEPGRRSCFFAGIDSNENELDTEENIFIKIGNV